MRSDKEILRIAQEDITNLTDEEYRRFSMFLKGSEQDKYRYLSERSSRSPLQRASGGKVCRGRQAARSAETSR